MVASGIFIHVRHTKGSSLYLEGTHCGIHVTDSVYISICYFDTTFYYLFNTFIFTYEFTRFIISCRSIIQNSIQNLCFLKKTQLLIHSRYLS